MIFAMLKEAWISIGGNKLRSFLTILGVMIGVCAVVLMVAVGQTVQNEINKELSSMGGNLIIILPGSATSGGARTGRGGRPTLTINDANAIKEINHVTHAAPIISMSTQVINGSKNWATSITGTSLDYFDIQDLEIERGMNFTQRDILSGSPYVIIGKTIEKELFEIGEDPIGKDIRVRNIPLKVIGVLKEKGGTAGGGDNDDTIITSVKLMQTRLFNTRFAGTVHIILLTVDKDYNMTLVERQVDRLLRERHNIRENRDPDFTIRNIKEMVDKIRSIGTTLSILLASVASISLLVGSIGIMNMMLVSVTERTREIGIRKALGAPDNTILVQFLLESIIISCIGSFIGMVIGIVLSQIGGSIFGKDVPISIFTVIISIVVAGLVGVLSGIVPALKATKLDPIEALRYQ